MHWMSDITTSAFAKAINMDTIRSVRKVQASDFLEGEQILDCVRRHGWQTAARLSYITDMAFAMARTQHLVGERPHTSPAGRSDWSSPVFAERDIAVTNSKS